MVPVSPPSVERATWSHLEPYVGAFCFPCGPRGRAADILTRGDREAVVEIPMPRAFRRP